MRIACVLTVSGTMVALSLLPGFQQKGYAQDVAAMQKGICARLNGGESVPQLAVAWANYVEQQIAMNRLQPQQRRQAHQYFGNMLGLAVRNYCPVHTQALIEAQSAASAGYQPPARNCNFNVFPQSPRNSTAANAANAWGNWFNNFGGRWMPRITGKTTQELYGCQ